LSKTVGSCYILFQPGVGTVTCIAFKNDQIVQGDVDGMLNIWDLKAHTSKNIHTGRGWIKKMRFAPGKGNLKLLILYSDGVDIVDLKKVQLNVARNQKFADVKKLKHTDFLETSHSKARNFVPSCCLQGHSELQSAGCDR
jgi:hypothetical protein